MVSLAQSSSFRRNKSLFFSEIASCETFDAKMSKANTLSSTMNYNFTLTNIHLLEREYTDMLLALKQHSVKNEEAFLLYCYYCASLLEQFYKAYPQLPKEQEYTQIKADINRRLKGEKPVIPPDVDFIDYLYDTFVNGFKKMFRSPLHISQIRDDGVAYINLRRIYWAFCRMALTQGFLLAKDYHLIEKLDAILGTHTDVEKIISIFKAPIFVINYFSVFLFVARFMIEVGLLLKHSFFPSELEQLTEGYREIIKLNYLPGPASSESYKGTYILVQEDESSEPQLYYINKNNITKQIAINNWDEFNLELSKLEITARIPLNIIRTYTIDHVPESTNTWDRFAHEFYKRHCTFANDLVWATVNGITNFNFLFHISGPVAAYITAGFLLFDVGMAFYKCHLAKQEYLVKKSQYLKEIEDYNNSELYKKLSILDRHNHIEMLNKQLMELEINWNKKQATFMFTASAAGLLAMGFTASLIVGSPALVLAAFLVCTLAVAMYLSTDAYSLYKEKSFYLEHAEASNTNLAQALKEYELARNDFIFTMIKNTVVPTVLIATFAVCWPAALVLTAVYLSYEVYHAFNQHAGNKEVKKMELLAQEEGSKQFAI